MEFITKIQQKEDKKLTSRKEEFKKGIKIPNILPIFR